MNETLSQDGQLNFEAQVLQWRMFISPPLQDVDHSAVYDPLAYPPAED